MLFLISLCFLFALLLIFILFNIQVDRFSEVLKMERSAAILYIVTDRDKPILTTVVFYNNRTTKTAFLDIPENTGAIVTGGDSSRMDRIDILFNPDDPVPYIKKVEQLIDFPIDFYMIQTSAELERTVDLMEGVNLFVASPISEKNALEWYLIPSGSVTLDGYKTSSYLKYAGSLTDTDETIRMEQIFIRSYFKRLGETNTVLTKAAYYPHLLGQFETNLDRKSFKSLLGILSRVDTAFSVFQYVRGMYRNVDGQTLLFPFREGEILIDAVRQIQDYLARSDVETRGDIVVSLEILNGTPSAGLASRTAQVFKSYGYSISSVGNADRSDYEQTVVIDRKGNMNAARKAAELIQCENIHTDPGANPDEAVDVLIILGRDFDGRYVKK
jgi:hypothetical protein